MAQITFNSNNGKSLNEQVYDVMKSGMSDRKKTNALVKLGLPKHEVKRLFQIKAFLPGEFDFSKISFGIEIEAYNYTRNDLIEAASRKGLQVESREYTHSHTPYYKLVSDSSIMGENSNELVSPVLNGSKGLDSLKNVCEALTEVGARVNKSCGLHVHIGAANMSDTHYCRLVCNYQAIENAIDSFMAPSRRGNNSRWCHSLHGIDFSGCTTKADVARALGYDRYYKVNAEAYSRHQTVEFRQHQGSTDFEKISHWVKFLAALVKYSENHDCPTCNTIEEIPFLTDEEKQFFIRRRAALN